MNIDLLIDENSDLIPEKARKACNSCGYTIKSLSDIEHTKVKCNVRAFKDDTFTVWRCPVCDTLHCLDVVDLEHYYSKYPVSKAKQSWVSNIVFKSQYSRLLKTGVDTTHNILDYGCGVNGQFVHYMRKRGFYRCFGYDPYAPVSSFGDPHIIEHRKYDYILLQDVIEHVENPINTLKTLDGILNSGGYIMVGTPNADAINLMKLDIPDFVNALHVPYHLHIYTRQQLESIGYKMGWRPVYFFNRSIKDTVIPGFNTRAWNTYTKVIGDDTFDSIYEDLNLRKAILSMNFLYNSFFGYWLSYRINMAILFQKS